MLQRAERHLLRSRYIHNGREHINFCSNDYLNLATHPAIKNALIKGAQEFGLGSTSSPVVSGYSRAHRLLEETFAKFLNRESALLFNSGYHANLGVLTTFASRNSVIIADKLCHASLIDGIVLSRANYYRYHHNNLAHAESLLNKIMGQEKLLVTESVFSMQGSISNIKKLADIANRYQAMLIVDDAHGVGVLGEQGGGICDYYQLSQHAVPCLITPLGKALGSMGAIVSGANDVIEELLQSARTYHYSTALPPVICFATVTAIKIIQEESWRRKKLQHLITFFNHEAKIRSLPLVSHDATPIKSILVGENKTTLELQHYLMQFGYFVSCIRPPTVPINTARLRISLNCAHEEKQIIHLLDLIHNYDKRKN